MATWIIIAASIGVATFFGWLLWRLRKSSAALITLFPIVSVVWVIAGIWFWGAISNPPIDTINWKAGDMGLAVGFSLALGLLYGLPWGLLLSFITIVVSLIRRYSKT
jgi:hypothetical protein